MIAFGRPFSLYLVTCIPTGKRYVGLTVKNLHDRWRAHVVHSKKSTAEAGLMEAIRIHGKDAFDVRLIEIYSSTDEACIAERQAILDFNTQHPHGLNLSTGGEWIAGHRHSNISIEKCRRVATGRSVSPEAREKIRQSKLGTKVSPETKALLSKIRKGKKRTKPRIITEETRRKLSLAHLGRKSKFPNAMKGKTRSEETKAKLRAAWVIRRGKKK